MNFIKRSPALKMRKPCATFVAFVASVAFVAFRTEVRAADTALYDRMLDLTQRELGINDEGDVSLEWEIVEPLEYWLPHVKNPRAGNHEEIQDVLDGGTKLCDREKLNILSQCPDVLNTTQMLIGREKYTRALSRDLQVIASGFEQPLLGGFSLPSTSRMQGIARMWGADIDTSDEEDAPLDDGDARIRTENVSVTSGFEPLFSDLAGNLNALIEQHEKPIAGSITQETKKTFLTDSSRLIAAVNRYRFSGVRWLRGKRPEFPQPAKEFLDAAPGTERELLRQRFSEVESALERIADTLINSEKNAELVEGEIVLFTFPKAFTDLLPENVLVWSYIERLPDGTVSGDAGLQWAYALEPTPLTLCSRGETTAEDSDDLGESDETADATTTCVPVAGGRYPPAPIKELKESEEDDEVETPTFKPLCMQPLMRAGLLCSPPADSLRDICARGIEPLPDAIQLAVCDGGEPPRQTEAGGDICANASWQVSQEQDVDPQTRCHVTLSCGPNPFDALTKKKDADGTIPVIMQDTPNGTPIHLLLHELAHARQVCNLPPEASFYGDTNTQQDRVDACCRVESDAYRVQCEAMAQDGVFEDTRFNAETCTHILTDFSCRERVIENEDEDGDIPKNSGACPWSFTYSDPSFDHVEKLAFDVIGAGEEWMERKNEKAARDGRPQDRTPETCAELLPPAPARRDPRIDAAISAMEGSGRDVCTPLQETAFRNTIGNAMCFLNRCWKESLTDHRLIPGRVPVTAGDSAFPFDVCMREDPQFGKIIPAPSAGAEWTPPLYQPALVLRELEESLCPGLPLGSPLCGFDPARRTGLPVGDLTQFAGSLVNQEREFQEPGSALRQLSEAIGIRIGTRLYQDFLSRKARVLTDFTTEAALLLSEFPKATFPTTLCPMNDADGGGLLGTPYCGAATSSSPDSSL